MFEGVGVGVVGPGVIVLDSTEVVVAGSSRYIVCADQFSLQPQHYAEGSIFGDVTKMVSLTQDALPVLFPPLAGVRGFEDECMFSYHIYVESSS